MANFWGCGKPRIYLTYPVDPANMNAVIDLPSPKSVVQSYEPVFKDITTRNGTKHRIVRGYRRKVSMVFGNATQDTMSDLTRIANWNNPIIIIPHIDQSMVGFEGYIEEYVPSNPKDSVTDIDIVAVTFVSSRLSKIPDYDNLISAQEGYVDLGTSLIANGEFADWTGDNPDDWTLGFVEDANNKVTNLDAGGAPLGDACRIVRNAAGECILQNMSPVGAVIVHVKVLLTTLGQLQIGDDGSAGPDNYTDIPVALGYHTITYTPTQQGGPTYVAIRSKVACDVTFSNLHMIASSAAKPIVTFDEAIYT